MRGRRVGAPERFHFDWNSFHAIWNAMEVLPVPVASVSRMRRYPSATASSAAVTALCW